MSHGLPALPAVILCGGKSQRMSGLTADIPKTMLTVGDKPMLWHIMSIMARHGTREFVIALGSRGDVIKDFFLHFAAFAGDFSMVLGDPSSLRPLADVPERDWQVTCVETGEDAGTGDRLRHAAQYVSSWPILVAYGDVLVDLDALALVRYHRSHGRLATVTAASPPSPYGLLSMTAEQQVISFTEKPDITPARVSAGFFVLERRAVDYYIPADRNVMFEADPVRDLTRDGQLMAYLHGGYWQSVDTPKDLAVVREQWNSGKPPWGERLDESRKRSR